MNKELRLLCLLLACCVTLASAGCTHKPAYSDINTNKSSRGDSQKNEGQAGAAQPAVEPPAASQPPVTPQAPAFKSPSFMDQASGKIKDLPNYPNARTVNVRIGPLQDANVAALVLETRDPMNNITAFYEKVIRDNHWTMVGKTIDPALSEWSLKKGEDDSARVQAKRDPQTGRVAITIVRGEKLSEGDK